MSKTAVQQRHWSETAALQQMSGVKRLSCFTCALAVAVLGVCGIVPIGWFCAEPGIFLIPALEDLHGVTVGRKRYPDQLSVTDQALAVVFQHLALRHRNLLGPEKPVFLSVGAEGEDVDPPEPILRYLTSLIPATRPSSAAVLSHKYAAQVLDRATGQSGIIFRVQPPIMLGENTATIRASYFVDGTMAEGFELHLERSEGRWKIIRMNRMWIA